MRHSKRVLDALVNKTRSDTGKAGERAVAKRKKLKTEREKYTDSFSKQMADGGQTPVERLNWKTVRQWFHEELRRNFGEKHTIPSEQEWWAGKEISLAKRLLKLYSGEMIHEGIIHLCENWDVMVENSDGKLTGIPAMGFLWVARERIIGEVEAGEQPKKKDRRKLHSRGEYDEKRDKMPGVGW